MSEPDAAAVLGALEATWPPRRSRDLGAVTIREGAGGGKRVSAANVHGPVDDAALTEAEAAMRALGQPALFRVGPGEEALDTQLARRGYVLRDPTCLYAAPLAALTLPEVPRLSAFLLSDPLAIMQEIWAEGGIGPGRLAVMARAPKPRTFVLGRSNDRPAGAAFAALWRDQVMVHAIEVRPNFRRHSCARYMIAAICQWAEPLGARALSLAVTEANTGARRLYESLGLSLVGRYHYRLNATEDTA